MPDPVFAGEVDPTVHARHPDHVALVLVASELINGPSDDGSDAQLAAAEAHVRGSGLDKAADHPHIAAWRATFRAFGAEPSRSDLLRDRWPSCRLHRVERHAP